MRPHTCSSAEEARNTGTRRKRVGIEGCCDAGSIACRMREESATNHTPDRTSSYEVRLQFATHHCHPMHRNASLPSHAMHHKSSQHIALLAKVTYHYHALRYIRYITCHRNALRHMHCITAKSSHAIRVQRSFSPNLHASHTFLQVLTML